jgi:hypothetical protein
MGRPYGGGVGHKGVGGPSALTISHQIYPKIDAEGGVGPTVRGEGVGAGPYYKASILLQNRSTALRSGPYGP